MTTIEESAFQGPPRVRFFFGKHHYPRVCDSHWGKSASKGVVLWKAQSVMVQEVVYRIKFGKPQSDPE